MRVVDDLAAATEHIRRYGSRHTEVILTEDPAMADRFLAAVDSAGGVSQLFQPDLPMVFVTGLEQKLASARKHCRRGALSVWRV